MAAPTGHALFTTFDDILPLLNRPEDFLVNKNHSSKDFTKALKCMYDVGHSSSSIVFQSDNTVAELTVAGFDDEQIWQQIDLENNEGIRKLISLSSTLLTSKDKCIFQTQTENSSKSGNLLAKEDEVKEDFDNSDEFQDENDSDLGSDLEKNDSSDEEIDSIDKNDKFFDFTGDSDEDLNYGPLGSSADVEDKIFEASDDDGSDNEDLEKNNKKRSEKTDKKSVSFKEDIENTRTETAQRNLKGKNKGKDSVVDDAFFKLADMAEFLDREDLRESRKGAEREEESDKEEDIDLFGDIDSKDENLHYDDFFDPPDIDEASTKPGTKTGSKSKKKDAEGDSDEQEDEDEEYEDIRDEKDQDAIRARQAIQRSLLSDSGSEGEDVADILGGARKADEKSTFEIRQEKLKKKITEMELKLLAEKPWQLKGEVNAGKRPENSLLQENLQFEYTTRLPPEITEETTKTLEDLIKQRIKDKAWDDVERKVKQTENPFEFKKRITLDQEKSKMSLGEIYEQEYLKQQQTEQVEKTDPDHDSIKKMMTSLFIKLDALSNFHYTPKHAAPEVHIITNQPSIAMEEVAPVAVSDAKLLAPEEIKDKVKGEMKGDSEKTKSDRLRERQKKKKEKRIKRKEKDQRQKLIEKLNPGLGNKYSKDRALRELEKESKAPSSHVTLLKDTKEKSGLTSSKNFFSQLQEEVSAGIKSKQAEKRRLKVDTTKIGVKKFKL
ncbi:U3 small nucleolar ribonucleoprotein protein MPP10-like isoform X2 [Dreissena polymorpha]|uniref:U3 small nucleolar ribonucleoprotein protein MPP10-like isoform X2 n=1 Tax=Dreissena polymorpha TaxID=45954 RepID=UPI002264A82D|nr:U3 small nucleolar ribonucleoprotein protein MPP10-like isoform X2 [Dreissena polymorpha]